MLDSNSWFSGFTCLASINLLEWDRAGGSSNLKGREINRWISELFLWKITSSHSALCFLHLVEHQKHFKCCFSKYKCTGNCGSCYDVDSDSVGLESLYFKNKHTCLSISANLPSIWKLRPLILWIETGEGVYLLFVIWILISYSTVCHRIVSMRLEHLKVLQKAQLAHFSTYNK